MNILLVDDDEVDRIAVARALRDAGVDITLEEADSVSAAAIALRERAFDCVLADCQLAPGDGLDVLERVRQAGSETPVVILTGHGSEQTAVELMKAGVADYLPKNTLSGERLAQSLRYATVRRRLEQERDRLQEREREAREEAEQANVAKDHFLAMAKKSSSPSQVGSVWGWRSFDTLSSGTAAPFAPKARAKDAGHGSLCSCLSTPVSSVEIMPNTVPALLVSGVDCTARTPASSRTLREGWSAKMSL